MIQVISRRLTSYIFKQGVYQESFEIHCYGIEVLISTIINVSLILILGLITNHFVDSIIFYLGFWIIRKFSGGYHCKTYFRCISTHVFTFVVFLITSSIFEYQNVMIAVEIFGFLVFLTLSPIKNRKCEKEDYRKYKILSMALLFFYIILSWFTAYSGILTYIILTVSFYMLICIPKKYV